MNLKPISFGNEFIPNSKYVKSNNINETATNPLKIQNSNQLRNNTTTNSQRSKCISFGSFLDYFLGKKPESAPEKPKTPKLFGFIVGCDTPEQGGFTGTLKKNDKPIPWVIEERPKTIDPKTGEVVYADTLKPFGAIA